jgi:hypothetical protein
MVGHRFTASEPGECDFFLLASASKPGLGATWPPTQWVSGALAPGVKRSGLEADDSLPSSDEVRMHEAIPPLPNTSSWRNY